jgi:hypothetical protein
MIKKLIVPILILMVSLISNAGCSTTEIPEELEDLTRSPGNPLTSSTREVKDCANRLEKMGITGITEEMIESLDNFLSKEPEIAKTMDITATFLTYVGGGEFDYDTWEWSPSSDQVYCFDVEVFNVGCMYETFLQGIISISNEEFEITEITENLSNINEDSGLGTRDVSFNYNGTPYTLTAEAQHDWFDTNMLSEMNQVFQQEGNPKKLYFMGDGYQECIVFYCTKEWALDFTKTTGCILYDGIQ